MFDSDPLRPAAPTAHTVHPRGRVAPIVHRLVQHRLVQAIIVVALTVVALAAIFALGAYAYGQHRRGRADVPHGDDTTADRERFLGFATLLLCGLSAVAVIYTAIVVFFFASCQ